MVDGSNYSRKPRWVASILRIYGLIGVIISIGAIGFFILRKFDIKINPEDTFTLAIAAMGLSLFVLSRLYLEFYEERQKVLIDRAKTERLMSSLLLSWSELERSGASLIDESDYDGPVSIRHIMKSLLERNFIDSLDFERLERALRIRNSVAHGMGDEIDRAQIIQGLDDIANVKATISAQLGQKSRRDKREEAPAR
jgi:uncharacterized protein YutE (UPF0331/DUF86 family)